jgi:phosphoglycolate phosphatase
MHHHALLFDLDGTLVDSFADIVAACNLLLAELGAAPLPSATLRPFIGLGARHLVRCALDAAGCIADPAESTRHYERLYAAHALDASRPYSGVQELLARLAGTPMAVISNKPAALVDAVLHGLHLGHHFRIIAGGETYPEMKPSPLPLLRTLALLGVAPDHALMVGDSLWDIEAGKAAGVPTCAALYGFQDGDALRLAAPDHCIEDFGDLEAILGV